MYTGVGVGKAEDREPVAATYLLKWLECKKHTDSLACV